MRRLAALVPLLLLAAGCVEDAPSSDAAPPAAAPPATPTWSDPVRALEAAAGVAGCCFEPTVATDSKGRIYVAQTAASGFAVSDDGATFTPLQAPPPVAGGGDFMVHVDDEDRVFVSSLVAGGIAVARSDDGGATWPVRTVLPVPADAPSNGADRQWLAFGPGADEVHVTYQENCHVGFLPPACSTDRGSLIARSTDGGASFGAFAPVSEVGSTITGHVVATEEGILVPYFQFVEGADGLKLYVARSPDGASWERSVVHAPPEGAGAWFPSLAIADWGHVLVWYNATGHIVWSLSTDEGATWREPRPIAGEMTALASPWAVPTSAGIAVLWFETAAGEVALRQVILSGPETASAPEEVATFSPGSDRRPARTDFAHAAPLGEGAILVYASDATYVRAWE